MCFNVLTTNTQYVPPRIYPVITDTSESVYVMVKAVFVFLMICCHCICFHHCLFIWLCICLFIWPAVTESVFVIESKAALIGEIAVSGLYKNKYFKYHEYSEYSEYQKYHEYNEYYEYLLPGQSDLKKSKSPLAQYPGCRWRRQLLPWCKY